MSPTPEAQLRKLGEDVADTRARLELGLQHSDSEAKRLARELVTAERRLAERLGEIRASITKVDAECEAGREQTSAELAVIRGELATVKGLITATEKRETRRASTTVAWVGGAFVVLASLIQTVGQIAA